MTDSIHFSDNIIERITGGKLAVAVHKGQIGWCVSNSQEFFKGSMTLAEWKLAAIELKPAKIRSIAFLAPIKGDAESPQIIFRIIASFAEEPVPDLEKVRTSEVLEAFKVPKEGQGSILSRLRDEVEAKWVQCPDDASALAVAVTIAGQSS